MVYDRRRYDGLTLEEKVDEALSILESLSDAFPDGPLKHREAHEAMIAASHAEAVFWQELKLDIVKKGTWGILVILLGLVLAGVSLKTGWKL